MMDWSIGDEMVIPDERFDRIDGAIERLGASIERIDASIERLTKYMLDFREEASTRLRAIESRLDLQAVALTGIDVRESRIPALTKAVLDAGSFSG